MSATEFHHLIEIGNTVGILSDIVKKSGHWDQACQERYDLTNECLQFAYEELNALLLLAESVKNTERTVQVVPKMPPIVPRRTFIDTLGEELDCHESNRDWADENDEAVTWLADNHEAIRTALIFHAQVRCLMAANGMKGSRQG